MNGYFVKRIEDKTMLKLLRAGKCCLLLHYKEPGILSLSNFGSLELQFQPKF